MYDMHSHLLWGIDDGAKSFEETKAICRVYSKEGTNTICATPHFLIQEQELSSELIQSRIAEANEYCQKENLNLQILGGCECYINPLIPDYIDQGKVLTLNNSKYLLIELPMDNVPYYFFDVVYKLQLKGIVPVLAHPERYSFIKKQPQKAIEIIEKGALLQCNAGSFLGLYGEGSKRIAFSLLKHNMVHIIGSDCHSKRLEANGPTLNKCFDAIKEFSDENNCLIDINYLTDNALKIIQNKEIDIMEPIPYEHHSEGKRTKKGFFAQLFKGFAN